MTAQFESRSSHQSHSKTHCVEITAFMSLCSWLDNSRICAKTVMAAYWNLKVYMPACHAVGRKLADSSDGSRG